MFFPVGLVLLWRHPTWSLKTKKIASGAVAVWVVVAAIGGLVSPTEENTTEHNHSAVTENDESNGGGGSDEPKEDEPRFDAEVYAAELEAAFVSALMDDEVSSMCDQYYTHWSCFYQGISADNESTVWLKLTTDGGWSQSELKRGLLHG